MLSSGRSLEGEWRDGRLEGQVREVGRSGGGVVHLVKVDQSDGSVMEIIYRNGLPNGELF